jgi:hypothetical protein
MAHRDLHRIQGDRYYEIAAAARLLTGKVSKSTLRRWVTAGWTSFDFPLDIIRYRGRLLIPEHATDALIDILGEHALPKPGTPRSEREEFKRVVLDFTIPSFSTYSRRRIPYLRLWHKGDPLLPSV